MKGYYVKALVEKDANMKQPVTVLAYEIPLLMAVFGEGSVQLTCDAPVGSIDVDPEKEYARLARKYGSDKTGAPHVVNLFGQYFSGAFADAVKKGAGVVGLKNTIPKTTVSKAKPNATTTAKPENPKDPLS